MNDIHIIQGDARAIPLRDEIVQCVVTSPPYWALRKYAGARGRNRTCGVRFYLCAKSSRNSHRMRDIPFIVCDPCAVF